AVHADGTIGVENVDLTVEKGELVLLAGGIGSGKSSLLASLAGLVPPTGDVRWNGTPVTDGTYLRPRQVAYVAQGLRARTGPFDANIRLARARATANAIRIARLVVAIST